MAKSKKVASRVRTMKFSQLKAGDRFQFTGRREGSPGRKPIFVKESNRAYTSRLGERVSTRALASEVRKVSR